MVLPGLRFQKKRGGDWRFGSSILFTVVIIGAGVIFGHLMPGFDPTAKNYFPHSELVFTMVWPFVCLFYYTVQTLPLTKGEIGSTTSVANDGIFSMVPIIPIMGIALLYFVMEGFHVSVFVMVQLAFASVIIIMDVVLNGLTVWFKSSSHSSEC